jgi:predicted TIM-barrel fold metal-dependent hydrolase
MDAKLLVNFPPDPNPKKPRLVAPPGSWDTHFHVWAPHLFPYAEKRRYTPPAAPVEHYLKIAHAIGLERGVIVQPSVHNNSTDVVTDAITKSAGRLRGMIIAKPSLTPDEAKRLHQAGVRGVRFNARHGHGNRFDAELLHRTAATVEPLGWILDLQIDDDTLVEIPNLIRSSYLPIIIDTFGHIDARKGLQQPAVSTLLDLIGGKQTHSPVYVKIHGANRFLEWGVPYELIVGLARTYIEVAPNRILWGTDWPHSEVMEPNRMPNDGDLIDMLLDYAPDEAIRRMILVDNPRSLFDFA